VDQEPLRCAIVLLRGGVEVARWPVLTTVCPDVGFIDRLARLQLAALRLGCSIEVRDASPELTELLDLVGLLGLLRQVAREPEEGEELGIEEVVMPDDTVA
jgi:hypothetical protein